jgi:hypothetical protein
MPSSFFPKNACAIKLTHAQGGHIMLVGISAYVCLAAELMGRYVKDRLIASSDYNTSKDTMKPVVYKGTLTPHLRLLVWVLALNTVCLIVRLVVERSPSFCFISSHPARTRTNHGINSAIYRIIELLDGFQGRIISKQ